MKRFIIAVLFGWSLFGSLQAAPSPDYSNYGEVNAPFNIDAVVFQNFGLFDINNTDSITNFIAGGGSSVAETFTPFVTQDTLYFTNSGVMAGSPGFRFDTGTATARHSANSFYNSGSILGIDTPADIFLVLNPAGDSINFPIAAPEPSDVLVFASNIVNVGSIAVGNIGLLQMTGSNINLQNSSLAAGTISEIDTNDFTGREIGSVATKTAGYFTDPAEVYDLLWGFTNGQPVDSSSLVFPSFSLGNYFVDIIPPDNLSSRGGSFSFDIGEATAYAFASGLGSTNAFYNVVFLSTNFIDSNISATVGFASVDTQQTVTPDQDTGAASGGTGDIVQFSETILDVITGQFVTNSIYLLDSGAEVNAMSDLVNASYVNGYDRPNCFEISTSLPTEWLAEQPTNVIFDPTVFYQGGNFASPTVNINDGMYEAQVGRDPESVNGFYQPNTNLFSTNFFGFGFADFFEFTDINGSVVDLPDITNEPGRIELTGDQVNLGSLRLRAEGVVTLNATNLIGTPLAGDWGNINSDLNVSNGFMIVSNIFPTNFQRLRGDVTAWSADWVNIQTNMVVTNAGVVTNVSVTNTIHYHVLWVQPDLRGSFLSSIRNLTLRATNTVVQDGLRVIDNALFLASNLTFNSQVVLTQNAGSLTPTNVPNLRNFFINTNAGLAVDSDIDLGFNTSLGHTGPLNRKYSILSITNFGTMSALVPLLQSTNFENDGTIIASNGAIVIEAASLGLGLALTNATNYLIAEGGITLSANSMQISNSQIFAGGSNGASQGLLLLESPTNGTGLITDSVSGLPSTNSPLINFWQVTDGFSLPFLPDNGATNSDLFGTEITTIATNYTVALHTWAGVDWGTNQDGTVNPMGFVNNMVIGHLKLSRQSTNALLHFTGAGVQNGMYVDYLELDTNSLSYSDYRDGLLIDPNLTIYFAAANVDPLKLEEVYTNRLVWAAMSFTGPNSTVAVPYTNCAGVTQYCLMNSNVAFSREISFFPPVPNADNQPFVLNDPNGDCSNIATNQTSCGSEGAMLRALRDGTMIHDFNVGTGGGSSINLTISSTGLGSVSPQLKKSEIVAGKKYTLTATPAAGWIFSGWSASGLSSSVETASPVLKFKLENDLVVTANFTPKTFTLAKGAYYGLFTNRSPASDNSGWFTFTLGETGALSGRLLMGPASYKFTSALSTNGSAQVVAKDGSQSLKVTLNLDLTDPTGQVTGEVSNDSGAAWESPLLGNIAPGWTRKNPSPFVGLYTMILANTNANPVPGGDSYGSLSVSKLGILSVAGRLADGNAFSQSVPVSANGLWPFYTYVARGNDFLLGWIAFQDNESGDLSLKDTNIFWSKAASSKDLYYPAGFTNTVELAGSPYAIPGRNSSGLSLPDPVIILGGGGLAETLTNAVAYDGKVTYATNNLTLSINSALGSFIGKWENPEGGPSIKLSGVVLQNQESAFGFFLGTNDESGFVLLQSQ